MPCPEPPCVLCIGYDPPPPTLQPPPPGTQDSDERACAYIAGPAPNRWGNFTAAQQEGRAAGPGAPVVPPLRLSAAPSAEEIARATAVRRAHPLYASVTLGEAPGLGLWKAAGLGVFRQCQVRNRRCLEGSSKLGPHEG